MKVGLKLDFIKRENIASLSSLFPPHACVFVCECVHVCVCVFYMNNFTLSLTFFNLTVLVEYWLINTPVLSWCIP